jgi:hypothetical protein
MANSKNAAGSWKDSAHSKPYRGTDAGKPKPPVDDKAPVHTPVEPGAVVGNKSGGAAQQGRVRE